jgi:hypothetical protein
VSAKPFIVALILGIATTLFIYRDKAAARFPKGDYVTDTSSACGRYR